MTKKIITPFLFLFFCISCQENNQKTENLLSSNHISKNDTMVNKTIPVEESKEVFFSIVENLRIRDISDIEGDIIGKMNYGQKAIFLNEESDFKEKIKIRGKMRYDNWKKIKIKNSNSLEEIEGWIYGGGVIKESDMYRNTSSNNYERKIIRANSDELSNILGVKIHNNLYYDGTVNYKKSSTGKYIKEGKFKLKGVEDLELSKNFEFQLSVEISGNYNEGNPNGIFEKKFYGYENSNVTTINYENGKCIWASFMGSSEGEDYNHREENPKDCSFKYIEDRLAEVNGWN